MTGCALSMRIDDRRSGAGAGPASRWRSKAQSLEWSSSGSARRDSGTAPDELRDSCRDLRRAQSPAQRSRAPVARGTALGTAHPEIFVDCGTGELCSPGYCFFASRAARPSIQYTEGSSRQDTSFSRAICRSSQTCRVWLPRLLRTAAHQPADFLLAALLPSARNDRIVRAALWATFLGFCAAVYVGGAFNPFNNSRHYFTFVTTFALMMVLTVGRSRTVANEIAMDARDVVIVVAVLASLVVGRGDVAGYYSNWSKWPNGDIVMPPTMRARRKRKPPPIATCRAT